MNTDNEGMKRVKERIGSVLGTEGGNGFVTITPANWLTILRLFIVPVFLYCFLFGNSLYLEILATLLFIIGAITDLIDGILARRRGEITPFGDFMDPLADKLLVLAAYWALWIREDFNGLAYLALIWIALMTAREVGLTLIRIWVMSEGSSVRTSSWGKWKTGIQLTTLIFTLLALNLRDILIAGQIKTTLFDGSGFFILVNFLLFSCALTSLVSGVLYLKGVATNRGGGD